MIRKHGIPDAVVSRLVLMRAILTGLESQGRDRVTSRDLARWIGATPATVRKDLSWLEPGSTGAAYNVSDLQTTLKEFLDRPKPWRTGVAGLGESGLHLIEELNLQNGGPFEVVAGFDSRTNRLEQLDLPFALFPTIEIVSASLRLELEAALIAVAPPDAQKIAERFVQGGVKILVNLTSTVLRVNRHQIEVKELGILSNPPISFLKNGD